LSVVLKVNVIDIVMNDTSGTPVDYQRNASHARIHSAKQIHLCSGTIGIVDTPVQ